VNAVVDTSVALKWFIIEDDHEKAKNLIGGALVAPDLLLAEISNAIWKKWRAGEMAKEQAVVAQSLVTSFVELVPSMPLADSALELAIELNHPVYDCFFLALSQSANLKLITADKRLIGRCMGTRFEGSVAPLT
jgi:predicted nucleic acid-binding protein